MNAPENSSSGLLAVDVGNSRVKLGWFPAAGNCTSDDEPIGLPIAAPRLPPPDLTLASSTANPNWIDQITAWLNELPAHNPKCLVASVQPTVTASLFAGPLATANVKQLSCDDLAIKVRVDRPEAVGIDRLANAVAACRIGIEPLTTIVIDAGTAVTIDLISADGGFAGGAILPGAGLAATSLHTATAGLPQLDLNLDGAPPALGRSTTAAITSGVYWGVIGGVREIVTRLSADLDAAPQILVTGGDATWIASGLADMDPPPRHIEHLTLRGIWVAAQHLA